MYGAMLEPITWPYSVFSITITAMCAGRPEAKCAWGAGCVWVGRTIVAFPHPASANSAAMAVGIAAASDRFTRRPILGMAAFCLRRPRGVGNWRTVGDQPCSAASRGEVEEPAREHEDPVLEPHQVPQVDDHPDDPGDQAAEPQAFDIGDGCATTDGGEVAFIDVPEGLDVAVPEPSPGHLPRVTALLHGHRRQSRQGADHSVRAPHANHVTDREHLGMAWQR